MDAWLAPALPQSPCRSRAGDFLCTVVKGLGSKSAELNGLLSAVSHGGILARLFCHLGSESQRGKGKVLFGGTLLQEKNSKGSSTGAGYWSENDCESSVCMTRAMGSLAPAIVH